jgi:hypothetical protein
MQSLASIRNPSESSIKFITYFLIRAADSLKSIYGFCKKQSHFIFLHQVLGNCKTGRQIHPVFKNAGFTGISVTIGMMHMDGVNPVDIFTRMTLIAMIESVKEQAIKQNTIDESI